MSEFHLFGAAVNKQFTRMSGDELYQVELPPHTDIFDIYLAAFPDGTNPIYRERTEHDCSCCKNFVRNLGRVVGITPNGVVTVWDVEGLPEPYQTVANILAAYVRSRPILSFYRTKESRYGAEMTREYVEGGDVHRWNHFWGDVARTHYSSNPEEERSRLNQSAQVLARGLQELTEDALNTAIELTQDGNLYRGEEHVDALINFRELKRAWLDQTGPEARALFAWKHAVNRFARFRNTAIGTLIQDLSSGVEIDQAVRSFESKVAPTNYKRPKSIITQSMVAAAIKTLKEAGLEDAVERRHARLEDVSVTDVLFVDNTIRGRMKNSGIAALLEDAVAKPSHRVSAATDISRDEFVEKVLPNSNRLEVLVQNKHLGNFVTLTAPAHADAPSLFKWGNSFAWSYDGDAADSIKARVKAAGGDVEADLRVSLAWFNTDDLDLHCSCPGHREIYYGNKAEILDVDMNVLRPVRDAVENMRWRNPKDGPYKVWVNNYTRRENVDVGFEIEMEVNGTIRRFSHPDIITRNVTVCRFTMRGGEMVDFKLGEGMSEGSASQEKWGIKTETLVEVDTVLRSPNAWGEQVVGNEHLMFILKDCKNPEPVRGIYNEFLHPRLEKHRKVFEVLGSKTKAQPSDAQLSGLGFTQGRGDTVSVVAHVDGRKRPYTIHF